MKARKFLRRRIPIKQIEFLTLFCEIILLIGLVIIIFAYYGISWQYFFIGIPCLWIVAWRIKNYGSQTNTEARK